MQPTLVEEIPHRRKPRVVRGKKARRTVWSIGGYRLALVFYTGEGAGVNAREIHLMCADGRGQVGLTRNAFDDNEPDWSGGP
jgi:hypothetical protein